MKPCDHLNFRVQAKVGRLTNDVGVVADFMIDVGVKCAECGMPFKFKGVEVGMSPHKAMASADRLELRTPIEPDDGAIRMPSRMPGFQLEIGELRAEVEKLRVQYDERGMAMRETGDMVRSSLHEKLAERDAEIAELKTEQANRCEELAEKLGEVGIDVSCTYDFSDLINQIDCLVHEIELEKREDMLTRLEKALEKIANGLLSRADGKWGYECSDIAKHALTDLAKWKAEVL